ncbi:MAG: peptide deformylase [Ruminococcaceae bacterium]|nr:peptide deformylase [Oscillospiraceae bacterium]
MAIRQIYKQGEEILTKKCREVTDFGPRLWALLDDMHDTVKKANGAGLAAPQVGIMRRAAVVLNDDGTFVEIVNPEIIKREGKQEDAEGCLSFPGIYGMVTRPNVIQVKYQDRNGKWVMRTAEGFTARAFCHEIDHLDGVCFVKHVTRYLKPEELE